MAGPAEEQLYELLSLTGGRERLVRSRHLAHGAATESVRVFAESSIPCSMAWMRRGSPMGARCCCCPS